MFFAFSPSGEMQTFQKLFHPKWKGFMAIHSFVSKSKMLEKIPFTISCFIQVLKDLVLPKEKNLQQYIVNWHLVA